MRLYNIILFYFLTTLSAWKLCARESIHQKSRAGFYYDHAFTKDVSRIIKTGEIIRLNQFFHFGLLTEVPYNKYLTYGFSFDMSIAKSPRDNDPRLTMDKVKKKLTVLFLGLSGQVKPHVPFNMFGQESLLYANFIGGLGVSPPLFFGAQALSNYEYTGTKNFPSIFPLYFETTPGIGLEMYIKSLVGLEVGAGYRMIWVWHPMVNVRDATPNMKKDPKNHIWYDITSLFLHANIKLTF